MAAFLPRDLALFLRGPFRDPDAHKAGAPQCGGMEAEKMRKCRETKRMRRSKPEGRGGVSEGVEPT
ncbi:MAG: hypothetical protein BWX68_00282 [Verrucomicrobia bacterium ADurb.Bin063]|jgi:hypothetical protein|nr:MAG: hypothetical protein BWX68_00282 [Verrucomicrobia bacterium ADurb.Bin063]